MDRYQEHLRELARSADEVVRQRGLGAVEAEVVFIIDVSRSMYPMYRGKLVQELATQLLALSLSFDDDGVIPAYAFGERSRHLGDLTIRDFPGYIDREVIRTGEDYQRRCLYAPVIDDVCRYYFPEDWGRSTLERTVGRVFKRTETVYPRLSRPRAYPVFAIFVTSGDCGDREATTDAIRRSSRLPIFWQFIGLSPPEGKRTRFRFLRKLDRLGNTHVDNCGFFEPTDVWDAGSLYDGMLNEFPSYLEQPQLLRMLRPPEEGGLTTRGLRLPADAATDAPSPDTAALDALSAAEPSALGPRAAERVRRRSEEHHEDKIDLLNKKIEEVRFAVQHTSVGVSPLEANHDPARQSRASSIGGTPGRPASVIIDDLWDDDADLGPQGPSGRPSASLSSVDAVFAALDAASPHLMVGREDDTDLGPSDLKIPPIPGPPPLPPPAPRLDPEVTRVGSLESILDPDRTGRIAPVTAPAVTRPPLKRPPTRRGARPVHTRTDLIELDSLKDDVTKERAREVDPADPPPAPREYPNLVSDGEARKTDATSRLQAIRERRRRRRTLPNDDL